jgi:hypothetical protein
VKGDLGAPFELGLFTPRKYNVGKVLDEWVFCFQRSLMRRVFYLAPSIGRQRNYKNRARFQEKYLSSQ